jgi:hypothetical protein
VLFAAMYIAAATAILPRRDGTGDGMPGTGTALDWAAEIGEERG